MKSKAPLVMMEQMVMILVFALAAALCLQAFVLSDSMSQDGQDRDRAVLLCQNTAESIKASARLNQAVPQNSTIYYNEAMESTDSPSAYRVEVESLNEQRPNLNRFKITAFKEGGLDGLFSIELALQEVG